MSLDNIIRIISAIYIFILYLIRIVHEAEWYVMY